MTRTQPPELLDNTGIFGPFASSGCGINIEESASGFRLQLTLGLRHRYFRAAFLPPKETEPLTQPTEREPRTDSGLSHPRFSDLQSQSGIDARYAVEAHEVVETR